MRIGFGKFFLLLLLIPFSVVGQVVNRYPYVQKPTETSVLVAWNTATSGIGTLHWGSSPSSLTSSLSEASARQKHAIELSGLQPNTQYYYQVRTDAGDSSSVEHFWTAKPVEIKDINFLHYGDCGYDNSPQNQLAGLMAQEDVDFAVVAGDVDQGTGNNYDNVFFKVYKEMLARDCHYTAIGNHDIIANGGADFFDAFFQPTNNLQQVENYYSFTWGNAKFISLDSNEDYGIGSDQHDFLLSELQCRDQEWLFVFFHHPPWTNAWDPLYYVPFQPYYQYDGNDDMRTDLVPYFEQYGVDFVLNGHSHCYQRGEMNGVHYVISGGGGASSLDQHTCNTAPSYLSCAPNIQQEIYVNEYVRFRISGDTVTYAAVDLTGNVVDSILVTKTWTPYNATITTTANTSTAAPDGSATAGVVGPRPPYTYVWSNGATTSTAAGLTAGTYTVTITDANGCQRVETAVVDGLVGVKDALAGFLKAYPNPFENSTLIEFIRSSNSPLTLEIWDMSGKKLRSMEGILGDRITLDRAGMKSGLYLLRLSGDGDSRNLKLVLQ